VEEWTSLLLIKRGMMPEDELKELAGEVLQRQLRKRRLDKGETKEGSRFVEVELASRKRNVNSRSTSALEVVLSGGRRIEVRPDFDSDTLERLLSVLERA
jgi:hypothetical protein